MVGQGPMKGFRVPGRSANDIRAVANRAASALGITFPVDLGKLLESLTRFSIVLDVVPDKGSGLADNVEACWLPETLTLMLKESVYERACRNNPRELFTIFHELGHALLGHRRTMNREHPGAEIAIFEDSEWQANQFAAEMAMPVHIIRQQNLYTPTQLMGAFGVSFLAAEKRLKWLRSKGQI